MSKRFKNYKGFSATAVLLAVLCAAVLGGVGYFVYHNNNKNNKEENAKNSAVHAPNSVPPASKTATNLSTALKSYSDSSGKFSLKYPASWVTASDPSACSPGILFLGPDSQSVGKCGSENFGQISLTTVEGDTQTDNDLNGDPGFKNTQSRAVSVANVSGTRFEGTAGSDPGGEGDFSVQAGSRAFPVGSKVVRYLFFTNNTTYIATYVQRPSGVGSKNVLADFDNMIVTSLQFKS
jgi:hypothetical protein